MNLTHLIEKLAIADIALRRGLESNLESIAIKVEKSAKEAIGNYQPAIGGFDAWQELADSTKTDRTNKGYTENDPLLRSGALRDSISHEVNDSELKAYIGSNSEIAMYQEFGTSKIPPRPFLGTAVEKNKDFIQKSIGGMAKKAILGRSIGFIDADSEPHTGSI